jgi:two-component system, NtrC family, sensor kinase
MVWRIHLNMWNPAYTCSNNYLERFFQKMKQTPSDLILREKLAAVGRLAAGIAHEINNPAAFVSSNLYSLARYLDDLKTLLDGHAQLKQELDGVMAGQPLPSTVIQRCQALAVLEKEIDLEFVLEDSRQLISESKEGTRRIQRIVSDLMEFTQPGHDALEEIDINASLESALNRVWNEIQDRAEVFKDFAELPRVKGYPQLLKQVFYNLLVNAAQAIEGQGKISITTRQRPQRVQIQIQDTGMGIAREILGRIFDPFFTTKQVGQGVGLGLWMVHTAIIKHGGAIDVASQIGVGTTFIIDLLISPP